jgi:hypothetical protein
MQECMMHVHMCVTPITERLTFKKTMFDTDYNSRCVVVLIRDCISYISVW